MQDIQYIKDKNAVLVPIERWEKLQSELVRLKKRVNKASILNDLKTSLTELKKDLRAGNSNSRTAVSADDFLAELRDAE